MYAVYNNDGERGAAIGVDSRNESGIIGALLIPRAVSAIPLPVMPAPPTANSNPFITIADSSFPPVFRLPAPVRPEFSPSLTCCPPPRSACRVIFFAKKVAVTLCRLFSVPYFCNRFRGHPGSGFFERLTMDETQPIEEGCVRC